MNPKPVLTKRDFVRRYSEGQFGNASPTWDNYAEWFGSNAFAPTNPKQLYHIRNRIKGGPTRYDVPFYSMWGTWIKACEEQHEKDLYISAMAPTEKTLIQGEVMRAPWGLYLYYSTIKKPMRDALQEQSHSVSGIIASLLLRDYLCPKSYEWLEHLLDVYPNHVVEFSIYSTEWGTIPGFNTVFWEVRKY